MYFVFDVDGAIRFNGEGISDNMRKALRDLIDNEHEIVFTSATPIREMLAVVPSEFHHHTMIGGNGSLIATDGKIVHAKAFSQEQMREIVQFIDTFEATYLIDGDWDYDYTGPHDHHVYQHIDPENIAEKVHFDDLPSVVKVLILSSKDHQKFAEKLHDIDVLVHSDADDEVLDIRPKNVHKRSALEDLGVEKDHYIAFGSDENDLTLFDHAHHSVMVGHHGELAALAKEVIQHAEDVEQKIIGKINELSERYAFSNM